MVLKGRYCTLQAYFLVSSGVGKESLNFCNIFLLCSKSLELKWRLVFPMNVAV